MKKIEAIIRKSKYSDVKNALHDVGVNFFSYWDATGRGNEKEGHVYRGVSYSTSSIQRRYLSIVVNDDFEEATIDAILKSGSTGEVGDGKIFVSDITECYRIRTGEKGGATFGRAKLGDLSRLTVQFASDFRGVALRDAVCADGGCHGQHLQEIPMIASVSSAT